MIIMDIERSLELDDEKFFKEYMLAYANYIEAKRNYETTKAELTINTNFQAINDERKALGLNKISNQTEKEAFITSTDKLKDCREKYDNARIEKQAFFILLKLKEIQIMGENDKEEYFI